VFDSSTFSNVLKQIPRDQFKKIKELCKSDKHYKSFSSWNHLVVMLYSQFSGYNSLRDIVTGFNLNNNHHYHLNCNKIARSTIADANASRNPAVFKEFLMRIIQSKNRKCRKEVEEVIRIIDSSPIKLQSRGHEWAKETKTRASCQGLKLHIEYGPKEQEIDYVTVTDANVNDITVAKKMQLQSGTIYVHDKGYYDYNWWQEIIDKGSNFVTRIKSNASYEILEDKEISEDDRGFIISDQVIRFTNKRPRGGKINSLFGTKLRLITVKHLSQVNKTLELVSSLHNHSAIEIANIYKGRWAIELFFKWIKQNLGMTLPSRMSFKRRRIQTLLNLS